MRVDEKGGVIVYDFVIIVFYCGLWKLGGKCGILYNVVDDYM